jgi:hypothetical protein
MGSSTEIITPDEALKVLNDRLADLKKRADMAVTDQASFIESAQALLDFKCYIRAVEEHFEPELAPLEEKVTRIKLQMSVLISPVKQWLRGLDERRKSWASLERQAAEKEAKKLGVEVVPSIPTVAGTRNQIHYYAEVSDTAKFLRAYLKAKPKEREFLSRFLTVDQQEVGKYARETKDNQAVEKAIPGSRAWSKG